MLEIEFMTLHEPERPSNPETHTFQGREKFVFIFPTPLFVWPTAVKQTINAFFFQ